MAAGSRKLKQGPRQLPLSVRKSISERLQKLVHKRHESVRQFGMLIRAGTSTTTRWFGPSPSLPDAPALYRMATAGNISLDWLMTGEGSEIRTPSLSANQLTVALREAHIDALILRGRSRDEAEKLTPAGADLLERSVASHVAHCESLEAYQRLFQSNKRRGPNIADALRDDIARRERRTRQ